MRLPSDWWYVKTWCLAGSALDVLIDFGSYGRSNILALDFLVDLQGLFFLVVGLHELGSLQQEGGSYRVVGVVGSLAVGHLGSLD